MAATPGVPTRWTRDRCLAVVGVDFDQADELVYSVEVPGTQTFATSGGVFVHNCIPIDPFYLTWAAQSYGVHTRFIELAGEINTSMPLYVLDRVMTALNERSKPLKGSRVLVLGAAYKPNVDDCRESPAIELMELLQERGVIVSYSDPYVPALPAMRGRTIRLESVPITPEMLAAQDCVLIATDHSAFDWNLILAHAGLVVDTRGATRSALGESGNASVIRA
ncbi:UDP binding domain-containing protein [Singulisphaera sp. Ch08]|uniref:UDP binding domain-containing protein n=1 Tax=Singulisphaera sp. Ch08 TaxID=3120278 RepID=UPI0038735CF7